MYEDLDYDANWNRMSAIANNFARAAALRDVLNNVGAVPNVVANVLQIDRVQLIPDWEDLARGEYDGPGYLVTYLRGGPWVVHYDESGEGHELRCDQTNGTHFQWPSYLFDFHDEPNYPQCMYDAWEEYLSAAPVGDIG